MRPAHSTVPPAVRCARGVGEGISAPAVPQRVRRRPSAGLAGAHVASSRRAGRGRERSRGGLQRLHRPGLEAALVAIDPSTGDLLAMVGGANYLASTFNRATRSKRQPGSAFKPFVYAAALEHGYSPVSVLNESAAPCRRPAIRNGTRAASAIRRRSPKRTRSRCATRCSSRTTPPPPSLQQRVGSHAVLHLAEQTPGLSNLPDVASLALGTGLVTPLDLTAAYTMFPGGGQVARPRGIMSVVRRVGQPGARRARCSASASSAEQAAFQMVTMLRDVVERGTGAPARALGVRGPVGGQDRARPTTITTPGSSAFRARSSSASGSGFDQPAPIGREAYGARVALPIWADFMKRTARALPAERVRRARRASRTRSSAACRTCGRSMAVPVYTEYFKRGRRDSDGAVPDPSRHAEAARVARRRRFLHSLGGKIAGLFHRR